MVAVYTKRHIKIYKQTFTILTAAFVAGVFVMTLGSKQAAALTQQDTGSIGIEGTIGSNPPTKAPTISFPTNGQSFTTLPVRVAGLCTTGLLVEVFKNNVLAGSAQCVSGSYSIQIDLFSGDNDLVARQYDNLNQASPDSNTVRVVFNDSLPGSGPRVSITSEFAKRGANPGETLTWPVTISGGTGPYAVSVDWGDRTAPDLISKSNAGQFNLQHTCQQSGIFNIIIKVTDASGHAAFLQVVGVCNGPIQQSNGQSNSTNAKVIRVVIWWPLLFIFPAVLVAFWLGRRSQLQTIRGRIRRGERPV